MPTKIKAVLFDLDGTLRDTQDIIYDSIQDVLKLHTGKDFSRQDMDPYIHHHREVYRGLVGEEGLEEFDEAYTARIDKLIPAASLFEHAETTLDDLRKAGYRLALVSSAKTGEQYLSQHGIRDHFEVLVGAQDVTRLKPDSEPVLVALERLGVDADEAVMIGDMYADMAASKAADVPHRIGITYGISTEKQLLEAGATHIIGSLAELLPYLEKLEDDVQG